MSDHMTQAIGVNDTSIYFGFHHVYGWYLTVVSWCGETVLQLSTQEDGLGYQELGARLQKLLPREEKDRLRTLIHPHQLERLNRTVIRKTVA